MHDCVEIFKGENGVEFFLVIKVLTLFQEIMKCQEKVQSEFTS